MIKVITYGTYDLLHYGHIRLLERAKALGDYLIVGITSDDFDKARGKINVQQSLEERVEAIRQTGLADKIIIEEYEGQKIDDIKRYNVDIFTVGSDWKGKFDYLSEYCQVVYLPRTEGVSSSEIRAEEQKLRLGLIGGNSTILNKYYNESLIVNGIEVAGIYSTLEDDKQKYSADSVKLYEKYSSLLDNCDAVYIVSEPSTHFVQIKEALQKGKHVLCESPIVKKESQYEELELYASQNKLILMEAIKTAYSMAYSRLLLLLKSGIIGEIVSIDATCTSLKDIDNPEYLLEGWNDFCMWAPTAMLPIFQVLGTDYKECRIASLPTKYKGFDSFTKVSLLYNNAVASAKVGVGVKAEGDLVIAGTKGYVYVPAPWWKTDYFEVRYENPVNNKRYFYQLDGEGIRYELVAFSKAIKCTKNFSYIDKAVTKAICKVSEQFDIGRNIQTLKV